MIFNLQTPRPYRDRHRLFPSCSFSVWRTVVEYVANAKSWQAEYAKFINYTPAKHLPRITHSLRNNMMTKLDQHFGLSRGSHNSWNDVHCVTREMAHTVFVTIQPTLRPFKIHLYDGAGSNILVSRHATASFGRATELMSNQSAMTSSLTALYVECRPR